MQQVHVYLDNYCKLLLESTKSEENKRLPMLKVWKRGEYTRSQFFLLSVVVLEDNSHKLFYQSEYVWYLAKLQTNCNKHKDFPGKISLNSLNRDKIHQRYAFQGYMYLVTGTLPTTAMESTFSLLLQGWYLLPLTTLCRPRSSNSKFFSPF